MICRGRGRRERERGRGRERQREREGGREGGREREEREGEGEGEGETTNRSYLCRRPILWQLGEPGAETHQSHVDVFPVRSLRDDVKDEEDAYPQTRHSKC